MKFQFHGATNSNFDNIAKALGIYALFSKKPVGFWANTKMFEVIAAMVIYTTIIDKKYRKR